MRVSENIGSTRRGGSGRIRSLGSWIVICRFEEICYDVLVGIVVLWLGSSLFIIIDSCQVDPAFCIA